MMYKRFREESKAAKMIEEVKQIAKDTGALCKVIKGNNKSQVSDSTRGPEKRKRKFWRHLKPNFQCCCSSHEKIPHGLGRVFKKLLNLVSAMSLLYFIIHILN